MKRKFESGEDFEEFMLDEILDMEIISIIDLLLVMEEDDWYFNQYFNEFLWDLYVDSEFQFLDLSDIIFCDDGVFFGICIGLMDYEVILNVLNELLIILLRYVYIVSVFVV